MSGYTGASAVSEAADGIHLDLATALGLTPAGTVDNPVFFSGFVARPDITVAGLLAVADVAASRYADAGMGARLASLDPVVTAGGDRLRFESFSACNGVYARFDLDRDGLGSSEVGFGTTNVDINLPFRTALARLQRHDALHLSVGSTQLRASSLAGTHVERKVALPDRWVRGLAEVPALSAAAAPVAQVAGPAIGRFLGALPRVAPPGPTLHALPVPGGLRVARAPVPGGVTLPGASRLRGSDRVWRFARRLGVHASPNGTTLWVFDLPGGHFTLALSPDPFRGFSGEGTLLTLLAADSAERDGRRLLDALGWAPTVNPADLGRSTGLAGGDVATGLAWLAASGRLGHDIAAGRYFHRELPVDSEKVLRRHPRLADARALVEAGGVVATSGGWQVRGSHRHHTIADAEPLRCTCRWEEKHAGTRGPCKHLLAVTLTRRAHSAPPT